MRVGREELELNCDVGRLSSVHSLVGVSERSREAPCPT